MVLAAELRDVASVDRRALKPSTLRAIVVVGAARSSPGRRGARRLPARDPDRIPPRRCRRAPSVPNALFALAIGAVVVQVPHLAQERALADAGPPTIATFVPADYRLRTKDQGPKVETNLCEPLHSLIRRLGFRPVYLGPSEPFSVPWSLYVPWSLRPCRCPTRIMPSCAQKWRQSVLVSLLDRRRARRAATA